MNISSDDKGKNYTIIKSPNKGKLSFGDNSLMQIISSEKKNQLLESYNRLSIKKKEIRTFTKDFNTNEIGRKSIKNSSSSINFNNYPDCHKNWVMGIKSFSSNMKEMTWNKNLSTMKLKKKKNTNFRTFYDRSSPLQIEKFEPGNENNETLHHQKDFRNNFNSKFRDPHQTIDKSFNEMQLLTNKRIQI